VGVDHFIDLNGARFRYQEWGDPSAPVVVFLHGVLLHADPYELIVAPISSAGYRVLALDQRGHGQSAHLDDYSWQAFVDDLAAFWTAVDLESVDVIGHSMGGGNACRFAALHPGAVSRLVLVDEPLAAEPSEDEPGFWGNVAALMPPDRWESREAFIAAAARLFPRAQPKALALQSREMVPGEDGRFDARYMPDLEVLGHSAPAADEQWEMCARVDCPVLVMRAEHSELLTAAGAAQIVAALPSATLVELPDSGHMVNWENPSGVADLSLAFLA
jgi:pimeloyl-ACP methyl ester carboxylesterase